MQGLPSFGGDRFLPACGAAKETMHGFERGNINQADDPETAKYLKSIRFMRHERSIRVRAGIAMPDWVIFRRSPLAPAATISQRRR
jgi:hypothetical protein